MKRMVLLLASGVLLAGCSSALPPPQEPSAGHIRPDPAPTAPADIPDPVSQVPILPEPSPTPKLETYTVVVSDVPVRELLFALARDASLNVDIHQDIAGTVTLNAVDQTLPQILDRLGRQVDLRYEMSDNQLVVMPDSPYYRTYRIDYIDFKRSVASTISVDTDIQSSGGGTGSGTGGGSGGGSSSGGASASTTISATSENQFWQTVSANILSIMGVDATNQFYKLSRTESTQDGAGASRQTTERESSARQEDFLSYSSEEVIVNPLAGVITVYATSRQHETIQEYVDRVSDSVRRQVLIEATIVEVELNDEYQFGVDWAHLQDGSGVRVLSGAASTAAGAALGLPLSTSSAISFGASNAPYFLLDYQSTPDRDGVSFTASLLDEFGDTKVLSSPKLMVLNNQTAILKVVDNIVYFEVTTTIALGGEEGRPDIPVTTTQPRTVPVGIVMHVTPQISDEGVVILNVRPSVTRIAEFVRDPNPQLTEIPNQIPQIQTREMDSILRVPSGQIAVLGGLMQDETSFNRKGIPYLSQVGSLFRNDEQRARKTELVIFLRPVVVREPDIDKDLRQFRPFLEQAYRLPGGYSSTTGAQP